MSSSNSFASSLGYIMKQNKNVYSITDLLKVSFRLGNTMYYFSGNDPIFRIQKLDDKQYMLIDEVDKIELLATTSDIKKLESLLKNNKNISNKSILDVLMEEYYAGQYDHINGKNYIVYDIETLYADDETLHLLDFQLGYSIFSGEYSIGEKSFKYISKDNLKKFVDFLLSEDIYIVGFNNLAFDNKVICYNCGYGQAEIDIINKKSIDIFMFIRNMTNKRIALNKVATGLIGLAKNLDVTSEGMTLLLDRIKNGTLESLDKIKKYCRNDVKMTLGVLLYLIKYKEFYIEGQCVEYSIDQLISISAQDRNKKIDKEKIIKNEFSVGLFA